jgi:AcrR family transcriptional regulator
MENHSDLHRAGPTDRSGSGTVIRDAALRRFAAQGVGTTTLRAIAADAGVSLGLVQHRFGTKERLVAAVDKYVLDLVHRELAQQATPADEGGASEESVEDTGRRVLGLLTEHPEVVDYMARAMVDQTPIGTLVFDSLFAIGRKRWSRRAEHGQLHDDVDVTWAALNPMLLALGAIILRTHVERQLLEPFTTPTQLRRWEGSVNALLKGQLR